MFSDIHKDRRENCQLLSLPHPGEDTVKRQPSASQYEGPHQESDHADILTLDCQPPEL